MPRKEQLDEYAEKTPSCKKRILLSLATDFPCKEELEKESEEKRKWEIISYKRYSKALQANSQYFQSYHADIICDYSMYIEQLHNLTAVSYTHLDVYKRQHIELLIKIYYQIDTRLSFATNIGSCSVILNASYQFWI